jgi:hypothetical protein
LLRTFPAVAVLGPRQCGKTTLVRSLFPDAASFDLERPSDLQQLQADPEYVLRKLKSPVILDEAQRVPELFPILRALIDERRSARGRFVLLGSAHPSLVRGSSESLSGRIGFLDLHPFCYLEVAPRGISVGNLWLRGGFPEPCLYGRRRPRTDWMNGYVRTFLERDLASLAPGLSQSQVRRFWRMLAYANGSVWNASDIGRSLGVSYHTVTGYADVLEAGFLMRRLQPYFTHGPKRETKSPKVYLTDTGLLHALLGIESARQLDVSPQRGLSWEGFIIEQIIRRETLVHPASRFYFWRTATGVEIDLLIDRGTRKIGFEIKVGTKVAPADWRHLRTGIDELKLDAAILVNQGASSYSPLPGLRVIPAADLLGQEKWAIL